MRNNYLFIILSSVFISGCSVHEIGFVNPVSYRRVADYAYDVIDRSGCMGHVDALFFPSGHKYTGRNGTYIYEAANPGAHCTVESFNSQVKQYCDSKGGFFENSWCSVNDYPLFAVGYGTKFNTIERGETQTIGEWLDSARKMGYRSKKEINLEMSNIESERLEKEGYKNKVRNTKVVSDVGDMICKEDYSNRSSYFRGDVFYKGYVEKITNNKIQVRLVWHGGDGFSINDVEQQPIIWSTPYGWYHCD